MPSTLHKEKKFLDTVHGYISIPDKYVHNFIDSFEFQRLRRIEQTSGRSIFPCARHDRFIHSLGVYFIGRKIYKQIRKRCDIQDVLTDEEWATIGESYKIACLLHDCGHAPFSHTFEKYYDKPARLTGILVDLATPFDDSEFGNDIDKALESAPHERLSAALVLDRFAKPIQEAGGDPLLVVRMIIGCKYLKRNDPYTNIANCFVSLLNGRVIDADKIDYVCRDKWASGYSATNVDVERLIHSIHLKKNNQKKRYDICYDSSALYEIQSVLSVKNFQYLYVINHHKVIYDQYILDKSIETLATLIFPDSDKDTSLSKLFNYDSYIKPIPIGNHILYLPSDDDLIHLLKQYLPQNEYAQEWFSRNHRYIPLWKSRAEFLSYFGDLPQKLSGITTKIEKIIKDIFSQKSIDFLFLNATPKFSTIDNQEVFIDINNQIKSIKTLGLPSNDLDEDYFFYVFVPKEEKDKKEELIDDIKNDIENILS
ncbi:HD domain-containing protein [Dysgonomonas reticulitermitis]